MLDELHSQELVVSFVAHLIVEELRQYNQQVVLCLYVAKLLDHTVRHYVHFFRKIELHFFALKEPRVQHFEKLHLRSQTCRVSAESQRCK